MLRRALRLLGWTLATWIVLSVGAVLALRWIDPPTSAFIIRERLTAPLRHRWVDDEHISPHVKVAVIAAEDQNFPTHYGFDLKSINEA
ncbi:MAG TPA: transglycosylase domain-containing protein, partial [Steroidobacteraceae bacterium]|nr:transglycosylase domain-containing protein [Steroidobacteraceae bacterium]